MAVRCSAAITQMHAWKVAQKRSLGSAQQAIKDLCAGRASICTTKEGILSQNAENALRTIPP